MGLRFLRRRTALVSLVVIFIGVTAYLLGWSSLFSVSSITISGAPSDLLLREFTQGGVALHQGERLARLNTRAMSRIIRSNDWVASEAVHIHWLSGEVQVSVIPREPIAQFTDSQGSLRYLDSHGIAFHPLNISTKNLPSLNFAVTSADNQERLQRLSSLFLTEIPSDILASMTNLSIRSDGTAELQTSIHTPSLTINWGSIGENGELSSKARVIRELLALPVNSKIISMDVSDPTSPTVH